MSGSALWPQVHTADLVQFTVADEMPRVAVILQVARSITGDMLRSRLDLLGEARDGVNEIFDQPGQEASRSRWLAGQAVPVCKSTRDSILA
jgi:hypothetical protein